MSRDGVNWGLSWFCWDNGRVSFASFFVGFGVFPSCCIYYSHCGFELNFVAFGLLTNGKQCFFCLEKNNIILQSIDVLS